MSVSLKDIETRKKIIELIKKVAPNKELELREDSLLVEDMGMSSLSIFALFMGIRNAFNIDIPNETILIDLTFLDLVMLVNKYR